MSLGLKSEELEMFDMAQNIIEKVLELSSPDACWPMPFIPYCSCWSATVC